MKWFYTYCHYIAGFLTALSASIDPLMTISALALFIIYELNEDWHIKDGAWKDIREYQVAFYGGIIVQLIKTLAITIALLINMGTAAFAISPEGEVWKYIPRKNPEINMEYGFYGGETYLKDCTQGCAFYKIPRYCELGDCVWCLYTDGYAMGFQQYNSSWGMLNSFFGPKLAIEFAGLGFIPVPPIVFEMEQVGTFPGGIEVHEYPPEEGAFFLW